MKKTFFSLFLILLLLTSCTKPEKEAYEPSEDEIRFRKEYESLNGEKNADGKDYKEITVEEHNRMVYADLSRILDLFISKESAVVYFGFPECPWCRSALPVLLQTAEEADIDEILYCNCLDQRDIREVDEEGNVTITRQGSLEYMQLLEKLGDWAEVYEGVDENAKRLYFPTVLVMIRGEIRLLHTGTVDSQEDPYLALTEEQTSELFNIYSNALRSYHSAKQSGCSIEKKC